MSRARKQCRPKRSRARSAEPWPNPAPSDPWPTASTPEGIGATPDEIAATLADRAASDELKLCDCSDVVETWIRTPAGVVLDASHPLTCAWSAELRPWSIRVP